MKRINLAKIITDIIIILLSIIAIIVIWGFVQVSIQHKEYVNIFGYSIFSTETGSMSKTIEKGDIVIVKLGENTLNEKDIITYKSGNAIITHRIKKIDGNTIIAKGDSNNTEDDPIEKDMVIGQVVYIFNNVEVWKKVFSDMQVIVPICITIILLIVLVLYKEKTGDENVE